MGRFITFVTIFASTLPFTLAARVRLSRTEKLLKRHIRVATWNLNYETMYPRILKKRTGPFGGNKDGPPELFKKADVANRKARNAGLLTGFAQIAAEYIARELWNKKLVDVLFVQEYRGQPALDSKGDFKSMLARRIKGNDFCYHAAGKIPVPGERMPEGGIILFRPSAFGLNGQGACSTKNSILLGDQTAAKSIVALEVFNKGVSTWLVNIHMSFKQDGGVSNFISHQFKQLEAKMTQKTRGGKWRVIMGGDWNTQLTVDEGLKTMPMFNLKKGQKGHYKRRFYLPLYQPQSISLTVPDKDAYGTFNITGSPLFGLFSRKVEVAMHPGAQQAVKEGFPMKKAYDVVVDSEASSRADYVVCTPPYPHVTDHALVIYSVKTTDGTKLECPVLPKKSVSVWKRFRRIVKNSAEALLPL